MIQDLLFRRLSVLAIWLIATALSAQSLAPGGVSGSSLWLQTQSDDHQHYYQDLTSDFQDSAPNTEHRYSLNHHPAKYLDNPLYDWPVSSSEKDQLSIFCVYQLQDTLREKHIWSLMRSGTPQSTLSSFRFADLSHYQYRDLRKNQQKYPELHSYTRVKDSMDQGDFHLILGSSQMPSLPLSTFQGIMPELIVYPYALSARDQQKVESYLAIKYGLNISQNFPKDYLDSQGQVIWDAQEHQHYHYHIFGIGKDTNSGLLQPVSHSSYAPELLEIGYSDSQMMQEGQFLFCADNGRPLVFSQDRNGMPLSLERSYRISSQAPFIPLSLKMDSKELSSIDPALKLYLEIDPVADPRQESFPKTYHPITLDQDSLWQETSLSLDTDGNGADILRIVQAPELFVQTQITHPQCGSNQNGRLQTKVEGGSPPYEFKLQNPEGTLISSWTQNDASTLHSTEIPDLGDYQIHITDSQGLSYTQDFYLSSSNSPEDQLASYYTLIQGQTLTLEAGDLPQGTHCEWYQADRWIQSGLSCTLTQGGDYQARFSSAEGCQWRKNFTVQSQSADNIRSIEIFPNPSDGPFSVRILLERAADTYLQIYTMEGKLLQDQYLGKDDYFMYHGQLDQTGVYLISIQSENDIQTEKLILQ